MNKDEQCSGKGILTYDDPKVDTHTQTYEGTFLNGLWHGEAVQTLKDGTICERTYNKGKLQGNCTTHR